MNRTGSWVWDVQQAQPAYWSAQMNKIHGRDISQAPPGAGEYSGLFPAEDWPLWVSGVQQAVENKAAFSCECRIWQENGRTQLVRHLGWAVLGSADEVTEIIGTTLELGDPTREPMDRPQPGDSPVSELVDLIPALAWSCQPDGSADFFNRGWLEYTGLSQEEAWGWGWTKAFHPDDLDKALSCWKTLEGTGQPGQLEARLRRFDGQYRWFLVQAKPQLDEAGRVVKWYGTNTDIENRKHAEAALGESERNFRQIVDSIPALVCTMTARGEVECVNQQVLEYFGKTLEELRNWAYTGAVHEQDLPGVIARWQHSVETGEPYDVTHRIRRFDGVFQWFHVRGLPLRHPDGDIARWYILLTDIEDRKRAEDAVRASEAHLRLTIDTIPALVWRADPAGEPDYLNARVVTYTGRNLGEFTRFRWEDLIHPDDLELTNKAWRASIRSGAPYSVKQRLRSADGSYRWFQVNGAPLRNENGEILSWFGLDIDIDDNWKMAEELRQTQAKLSRATQIATVAELSASIAHEINQPLAAAVANGHACQAWLSAEPPNLERARLTAGRMIRDVNSAAGVVQRIRALFKRSAQDLVPSNINEVISAVLQLTADELRESGISTRASLADDLPGVAVDRVQMQQTLLNLIRNAIEAMEGSGDRPKVLSITSRLDDSGLLIQISDTGCGLTDTSTVFEPFVSTKERGMGMGLSICRSIVESHGGRLWAASNEGVGTTFSFTLPLHRDEPS
ncbi:PAS domain-containing sensor histidine kinase [Paludibaculum fermentans]|uniref:histidine kinase n=1 Tax=Paludibaculum fermentans TaxID=1473598 RepID=A0A7S7SIW5_PALFE|nr:PAS domain-containing protein [Paludibaculum fermentans]QOY85896.1 PAS domain-containing protein [Paludibaculum fermentans]